MGMAVAIDSRDISAAGPASRPVDLVHLARQTLGNRDIEAEVLRLFVRQSPHMMARILGAIDDQVRRDAAHGLCGSARAIGAWGVAETADALAHGSPTDPGDVTVKMSALDRAVADVNRFILTLLG